MPATGTSALDGGLPTADGSSLRLALPTSESRWLLGIWIGGMAVRLDDVVCSSCCISASISSCLSLRRFPMK